ncbi:hypothetical protein TPHA_0H00220 [Tetrapisispora phaffii CBS 4417]|uniref:Ribonucleases P/MRP subunit Pop8-like domain-containing protein n=1 Tax=Tetrapisispora phaffii (strain ATCC 24235 / CBS 4417 / NBRC 1672 / NRRL Y-8282 / UCD 70-5) TaxID=1071381 RepID=G8BWS9_TETPH|nr:hypothetical protein TPHA_0H00220 [Tetrapisispora phaffii CBS 4417]CCE64233.1 hypothetical protein TPHA_0H00220 [Tetrapisispora phaffii CBS 4417]
MSIKKVSPDWYYFKLKLTSQDPKFDVDVRFDELTWRRWLNAALVKSYGIFGESIEYTFLNRENQVGYVRVGKKEKDMFITALFTYISTDELFEVPLVMNILQETDSIRSLDIQEDDKLWLRRCIEEEENDQECE